MSVFSKHTTGGVLVLILLLLLSFTSLRAQRSNSVGELSGAPSNLLTDTLQQIDAVDIKKSKSQINRMDGMRLSVQQVEALPKMMGLADPLKAVRFLPGFGNGGDANAGLFYRGLSSGNNGYYYNGVAVHNPSHLFGLFPIFNTHVIDEVAVHNQAAPGHYLGKLSGYIDVESDWHIRDTTVFKGELSLLHMGLGARIERDSMQMVELFWRQSFMNRTLWPMTEKILSDQEGVRYDLYDININAKQRFGRNSIKLFAYTGQDKADFGLYENSVQNYMKWGNALAGLSHHLAFTPHLQLDSRLGYSQYNTKVLFDFLNDNVSFDNRQQQLSASSTLIWNTDRGQWETGLVYATEGLRTIMQEQSALQHQPGYDSYQHIVKYFVRNQHHWNDKFTTDLSLHNTYVSGTADKALVDPAVLVTYRMDSRHSFMGSGVLRSQPAHQIALTNIQLPIDYVLHSSKMLAVSRMKELSAGYRYDQQGIEFSVDGYYRWMTGLKEFNDNIIQLYKDQELERGIVEGTGQTYGVDFFTKANWSKHYLTVNYAYSRSFRQFDAINGGGWFRYTYDRPHNLNIVHAYRLHPKLSLSASFVYSSGTTYTPTLGLYYFNNAILAEYGAKNSDRVDAYHRLDIGLEYLIKQRGRSRQNLGVSVINVYNRKNPIYTYLSYERGYLEEHGAFRMMQKSGAYLPLLPAITYTFELL